MVPKIDACLRQLPEENVPFQRTRQNLVDIVGEAIGQRRAAEKDPENNP